MPNNTDLNNLLETAIIAAVEAGNKIMYFYESGFETDLKADQSPLTSADLAAHRIIADRLASTGLPLLSEEGADIDFETRRHWPAWWLVDPLDGTKEFIKRNGEFTVNIALMIDNAPVAGVIYLPVKSLLYFAVPGMGSFRLKVIEPLPSSTVLAELTAVSQKLPLHSETQKVRVLASRSHGNAETDDFINKLQLKHHGLSLQNAGSSYKFCLVAEGSATHYPRFGPTMEWDIAAGVAILLNAGGKACIWPEMTTLLFNKPDLTNPFFLAVGYGVEE
jgi:3'(2'), 5'-bisphosphate nucleotidase